MKNPWKELPKKEPFVLQEDLPFIERFNEKIKNADYKIILDQPPAPFIGNPEAPVVLLNLNPGYQADDNRFYNQKSFRKISSDNLTHRDKSFYFLDDSLGLNSGYTWWTQKLKEPMKEVGVEKIIKNMLVVEYFPYHSKKYKPMKEILDSQKYSRYLVEKAIERKAFIVLMRSEKLWMEFMPALRKYPFYKLRNTQNPALSRKNLNGNFDQLLQSLRS